MLCVIAKLDKRSTEKLTAIQKAAAPDADGKPLHGHITLATYMGEDGLDGGAPGMLGEREFRGAPADRLRIHDFIGFPAVEDAVLVDA